MDNTPVTQTTTIPIEPIPPPSSSRNYLKFIIGGLIILGVVIFGGYFLVKSSSKPAEKACTMEAKICPDGSSVGRTGPNCEFTPCPEITNTQLSPTPAWETYSNDKYNFSLSYPPTMKLGPKYESNSDTRILVSNQLNLVNNDSTCKGWIDTEVVTLGSGSISIWEKIANRQPINIKVGNSDAYKLEWVSSSIVADSSEPNRVINTIKIIFPNKNYDYSITGYINNNCNNIKDFFILFDQILSTFKFLDQNTNN